MMGDNQASSMKPNALKALAVLEGRTPLPQLARTAGLPSASASRAVTELEALGFARKRRRGLAVDVEPLPFYSFMDLRDELARHPRLDLAAVARGRRAGVVAGFGHGPTALLREVTGFTPAAMRTLVKDLDRFGVLLSDDDLGVSIAPGHRGLQAFCQDICDHENALDLKLKRLPNAHVLWSRSVDSFLALPPASKPPAYLRPAAYTAAAKRGIAFLSGERYYIRSRRRQTWADTVLQCLLVVPRDRLSLTHAAIMVAHRNPGDMKLLARWYGVADVAARVSTFVRSGGEDAALLPRSEVKDIAQDYGVVV